MQGIPTLHVIKSYKNWLILASFSTQTELLDLKMDRDAYNFVSIQTQFVEIFELSLTLIELV